MKVREIMTTRVVTVSPDTPVPVIASLLRDNQVSGVPVVDSGGAVVGLVSEYDLLAREGETAGEVMTASVVTVTEDTDGEAVRQPVVRGDQVAVATTMTLTLSIDHRAVDGATAAGFLTRLKELIEQPLDIVL